MMFLLRPVGLWLLHLQFFSVMFTIPELRKINQFTPVSVPKASDLFARFGFTKKTGGMSGDESFDVNMSKVETAASVEKLVIKKSED